ncbi:helix-turn-helix transcriptional regulator [Streptomyces sp. NEAU-Y11]|uniref:helix-turn-helix transcriptional regulator n=1 Tax=Streptomyces cucumeris TaxID=2962890 RepID=UPI0035AC05EC
MVNAPRRPLASAQEVADYLGVPIKTLYGWKQKGTGPRLMKVGKHLKARWSDVETWLDQQSQDKGAAA